MTDKASLDLQLPVSLSTSQGGHSVHAWLRMKSRTLRLEVKSRKYIPARKPE